MDFLRCCNSSFKCILNIQLMERAGEIRREFEIHNNRDNSVLPASFTICSQILFFY